MGVCTGDEVHVTQRSAWLSTSGNGLPIWWTWAASEPICTKSLTSAAATGQSEVFCFLAGGITILACPVEAISNTQLAQGTTNGFAHLASSCVLQLSHMIDAGIHLDYAYMDF